MSSDVRDSGSFSSVSTSLSASAAAAHRSHSADRICRCSKRISLSPVHNSKSAVEMRSSSLFSKHRACSSQSSIVDRVWWRSACTRNRPCGVHTPELGVAYAAHASTESLHPGFLPAIPAFVRKFTTGNTKHTKIITNTDQCKFTLTKASGNTNLLPFKTLRRQHILT